MKDKLLPDKMQDLRIDGRFCDEMTEIINKFI
jgi:hypothetical protein